MLEITINGQPRAFEPPMTLSQLLEELAMQSQNVAVEVNLELVPRANHADFEINPGDELEIVTLAGGG